MGVQTRPSLGPGASRVRIDEREIIRMRWGHAAAVLHSRRSQLVSISISNSRVSASNQPSRPSLSSFFFLPRFGMPDRGRSSRSTGVPPTHDAPRCIPQRALPIPPIGRPTLTHMGVTWKVSFSGSAGAEKPWLGRWIMEVDAVGSISSCTAILPGMHLHWMLHLSR